MAEVLVFHHALGRTAGMDAFADELRRAGHVVHVPDLSDGRVADQLPAELVYAGLLSRCCRLQSAVCRLH